MDLDLHAQKRPTIFKYPIGVPGDVKVPVPATFLHLGHQHGVITAWFQVDEVAEEFKLFRFRICGTGHPLGPEDGSYIGTVPVGPFVWHVFMREESLSAD